jgi:hypothetical protein
MAETTYNGMCLKHNLFQKSKYEHSWEHEVCKDVPISFVTWKSLEHEINKTNKSMMQIHTLTIVEYSLGVIRRGRLHLLKHICEASSQKLREGSLFKEPLWTTLIPFTNKKWTMVFNISLQSTQMDVMDKFYSWATRQLMN